MNDLRTKAIILRRTNYGESDRILSFITPNGKISALAHGARKEKSRLAGGIELFSVADIVIHQGRGRLGTLTSSRMLKFYGHILESFASLELASSFLKRIERAAEQADNPEHFELLNQAFLGLNNELPESVVLTWFNFNYARALGEEINLIRDVHSENLSPAQHYFWDTSEDALHPHASGSIGEREIKLARVMLSSELSAVAKIEGISELLPRIAVIAQKYA